MRECEEIQELISLLLDGELGEAEEKTVREHIAGCEECREMYEAFAAVSGAMRADAAPVPAALHDKIMDGVRAAKKKRPGRVIRLRHYAAAAACLVVVLGAALALGRGVGFDSANSASAAAPAAAADQRASGAGAGTAVTNDEQAPEAEEDVPEAAPSEYSVDGAAPESAGTLEVQEDEYEYGYTESLTELLSARLVGKGVEHAVEDLDSLSGLLGEQPAESTEDDLAFSGEADCLLYLETAEGERELSLYFRGESVYVLSDDGTAYLAAGTAQEFREIE